MDSLLAEIRKCTLCKEHLPLPPRPILQFSSSSRLMIIGQAPGIKAHQTETPWNDASGERLRDWMGIGKELFYDTKLIAIVPMGFCYPGRGKSGDNPPRPECSLTWMEKILNHLKNIELKIVIGQYATNYFLPKKDLKKNLTETLLSYEPGKNGIILLPHPSPRNNIFLKRHPWVEEKIIPALKKEIRRIL